MDGRPSVAIMCPVTVTSVATQGVSHPVVPIKRRCRPSADILCGRPSSGVTNESYTALHHLNPNPDLRPTTFDLLRWTSAQRLLLPGERSRRFCVLVFEVGAHVRERQTERRTDGRTGETRNAAY